LRTPALLQISPEESPEADVGIPDTLITPALTNTTVPEAFGRVIVLDPVGVALVRSI
jgi:hypothetical protein